MNAGHPTGERLNAYLLEDLDIAERRQVRAHLQACAKCRDTVEKLEVALTAYRDADPGGVDDAALGRLLIARPAPRAPGRRWATVAMAAAAATVIFLGGFWTGQRGAARPVTQGPMPEPNATTDVVRHQPDRNPPTVTFAVADADLLGGLAPRDTTWN